MKTACPYHTREVHAWSGTDEFITEVKDRARVFDLVLIAVVPVILVLLHTLPLSTRRVFALDYSNPSIITAYTSNFVHIDTAHLFGNLGAYLAIVPLVYILSILSNRRRHFRWNYLMVLGGCPFVVSGMSLLFHDEGIALGFSGLAMAFYGYASLIFVGYLATRLTTGLHLDHAPLIFFVQTTAVSVIATPGGDMNFTVTAFSAGLAVLYFVWVFWSVLSSESLFSEDVGQAGYVEVAVFMLVAGGFLGLQGFSESQVSGGSVSVFAHLIGFTTGFIIAYVVLRTDCSIAHIRHCAGPYGDCDLHDSILTRLIRRLLLAIQS